MGLNVVTRLGTRKTQDREEGTAKGTQRLGRRAVMAGGTFLSCNTGKTGSDTHKCTGLLGK